MGREDELNWLHDTVAQQNAVAVSAVAGMGGIGKTELATQYATQYKKDYRAIAWIRESIGDIRVDVINYCINQGIKIPQEYQSLSIVEQIDYCWQEFHGVGVNGGSPIKKPILVVFDDITNINHLGEVIPKIPGFGVIITTRIRELPTQVVTRYLDVLEPDAAFDLLKELVGKDDPRMKNQEEDARKLCQWLEYLPLGVELVGGYLHSDPDLSCEYILEELQELGLEDEALQRNKPTFNAATRGVKAAFELTWSKLSSYAQETALLLSAFAPQDIIWKIVERTAIAEEFKEVRQPLSLKKRQLNNGKKELIKYHVLQLQDKNETDSVNYRIHALVHLFLKENLAEQERFELLSIVTNALIYIARSIDYGITLEQVNSLSPFIIHLEALAKDLCLNIETVEANNEEISYIKIYQQQRQLSVKDEDLITANNRLGRFYEGQGNYATALPWYEQNVKLLKSRLGDRDPDTATSLNDLAKLYVNQGRYPEAEPLYKKALALRKEILGSRHPSVASSLNNLAELHRKQGRYPETEPLYKEALALRKEILGSRHPSVASSLNNLAILYYDQGRYIEVEPLLKEALALRKEILGDCHPYVADSLNNLAGLYYKQGRYLEVEPLYKEALALRKEILGDCHPYVADSLNNLALIYDKQGRYPEAESLYKQALALHKEVLGDRHPNVAISLHNLAGLYYNQQKYLEAEPLYKKALALRKELLGDLHPDVADSLYGLAELYHNQEKYPEAEPLHKEALALRKQIFGDCHPHVAFSLNGLARLYSDQRKYSKAELLYKESLTLTKKILGDRHPHVATSLNDLASLYGNQERYQEAEPLFIEAVAIAEETLGFDNPKTVIMRENLAYLRNAQS
ncbi:tetratricopeptide repeat protein [Crocosphaera sp.]|uniref:tetratricopeptide repeat protein n=1 Tax=Crocosphaera sp. TaxID=2729996 RepID=UPI00262F4636|nr:tetratricopeptide repeat protein [Crocosphaera sp.]MDJ0578672.1 tetratricopeptide repeat protein [Crocosphaera sp.]